MGYSKRPKMLKYYITKNIISQKMLFEKEKQKIEKIFTLL